MRKPGKKPGAGPSFAAEIKTAAKALNSLLAEANEAGWEVELTVGRRLSMSAGAQPVLQVGRVFHRDGDFAEEVDD